MHLVQYTFQVEIFPSTLCLFKAVHFMNARACIFFRHLLSKSEICANKLYSCVARKYPGLLTSNPKCFLAVPLRR